MKCNEEALSVYIDDELDAQAREEVDQHLTECSQCTETLDTLKRTQARLRENCEEADLHTTVMQRVRRADEVLRKQPRRRLPFRLVGAAAALVLLVIAAYAAYMFMTAPTVEQQEARTTQEPDPEPTPEIVPEDERLVEAPPEPTSPQIIEAVSPETVEPPAPPTPPSGYWNATLTIQEANVEQPQTAEIPITFTNSNGEISLQMEGNMIMHGTLNVRDATFEAEMGPGIRYTLRGTFNPAFTVFEGKGGFTYDEYPQMNSQFEIYATKFTEEQSKPYELAALFEEREEEVNQLARVLWDYANAHDDVYPESLKALPAKAREPFTEKPGVEVTLSEESPMRLSFPGKASFSEYKTEYPYPDRLMMFEGELAAVREKGRSQKIMRIAYDEPKMVFAMDAFGMVHTEEFDRSGLPQRAASGAQAEAMSSSCANNMKQWGIIFKMFESEYEGYTPPSMEFTWPEYMTDTAILTCPADQPGEHSYEYLFPATHLDDFARIAALEFGYMTEEEYNGTPSSAAFAQSNLPLLVERNPHILERDGVPVTGFNVLFADGHVTFYTQERLDEEIGPYYALR